MEKTESLLWGRESDVYTRDFCCANPDCPNFGKNVMLLPGFYYHIVGVGYRQNESDRHFAQIMECPECRQTFWFHITAEHAHVLRFHPNHPNNRAE